MLWVCSGSRPAEDLRLRPRPSSNGELVAMGDGGSPGLRKAQEAWEFVRLAAPSTPSDAAGRLYSEDTNSTPGLGVAQQESSALGNLRP